MIRILTALCLLAFPILLQAQEATQEVVYFAATKAKLAPSEQARIDSTIQLLRQTPQDYEVLLTGHTDNVGSLKYNQRLSINRCKAVRTYLEELGFNVQKVLMEGKNFADSVVANTDADSKAKNRRVEILFKTPLMSMDGITEKHTFEASKGITFIYDRSYTEVRIPAGALLHQDGTPVTGEVQLDYKEFRDAADFIVSGIPMHYNDQHFNSAGMFEIQAYQDGELLLLDPMKPMTIDFALTDTLTNNVNFYEFDQQKQNWTFMDVLDRQSGENDLRGMRADERLNASRMAFQKTCLCRDKIKLGKVDTLKAFKSAMKFGHKMSDGKGKLRGLYFVKMMSFQDRWRNAKYAGTDYYGKLPREKAMRNSDWYNLQIELLEPEWTTEGEKLMILIKDLKNKNSELGAITANHRWKLATAQDTSVLHRLTANRWADARLQYAGDDEFELTLKDSTNWMTVLISPDFTKEEVPYEEWADSARAIFSIYAKELNNRRRKFEKSIETYRNTWDNFYTFARLVNPEKERCVDPADWVNYFDKNFEMMNARFDSLRNLPITAASRQKVRQMIMTLPPPAPKYSEGSLYGIGGTVWDSMTVEERVVVREEFREMMKLRREAILYKIPEAEWASMASAEKQAIRDKFKVLQQRRAESMGIVNQQLKLSGFGVYNCDQIRRLKNPQSFLASYELIGKDGNVPIDNPFSLRVIDYSINGSLGFAPNSPTISLGTLTSLFLVDSDGNKFLAKPTRYKLPEGVSGIVKNTFKMKDISHITDLNELKKVLML